MANKYYSSETGDIELDEEQQGQVPVEPLRIPGIVEQFMQTYIPAMDEQHADEVLNSGALRDYLHCWFTFGAKVDVLQEYLDQLADNGYIMQQTASGPALCLMLRNGGKVIDTGFVEAEECEKD